MTLRLCTRLGQDITRTANVWALPAGRRQPLKWGSSYTLRPADLHTLFCSSVSHVYVSEMPSDCLCKAPEVQSVQEVATDSNGVFGGDDCVRPSSRQQQRLARGRRQSHAALRLLRVEQQRLQKQTPSASRPTRACACNGIPAAQTASGQVQAIRRTSWSHFLCGAAPVWEMKPTLRKHSGCVALGETPGTPAQKQAARLSLNI